MLSETFYRYLASLMHSASQGGDALYIAIGSGEDQWDTLPPVSERSNLTFVNEIARLPVSAENIMYIDTNDNPTAEPTWRIRVSVNFRAEGTTGAIRETGLFGMGASTDLGGGQLLSYFTHARIDKSVEMDFERQVTIDLSPSAYRLEGHLTRYLGNASSEELHDLENVSGACQIDQLRIDRRHYFDTTEQALEMGYDYCAFCFGRDLSQR